VRLLHVVRLCDAHAFAEYIPLILKRFQNIQPFLRHVSGIRAASGTSPPPPALLPSSASTAVFRINESPQIDEAAIKRLPLRFRKRRNPLIHRSALLASYEEGASKYIIQIKDLLSIFKNSYKHWCS
jgi:hypothetical protein